MVRFNVFNCDGFVIYGLQTEPSIPALFENVPKILQLAKLQDPTLKLNALIILGNIARGGMSFLYYLVSVKKMNSHPTVSSFNFVVLEQIKISQG